MKKIIMLAALPLAIVGMAAPAQSDDDSDCGNGNVIDHALGG
ncbi:hypothetical protein ACFYV5_14415 [Streptomyces sp. NPDC003035]